MPLDIVLLMLLFAICLLSLVAHFVSGEESFHIRVNLHYYPRRLSSWDMCANTQSPRVYSRERHVSSGSPS